MDWLRVFGDFIANLTPIEGILLVLVLVFHRTTIKSHKMRVVDKQKKIDRLAKENHEYRDRFMYLLDIKIAGQYSHKQSTSSQETKK